MINNINFNINKELSVVHLSVVTTASEPVEILFLDPLSMAQPITPLLLASVVSLNTPHLRRLQCRKSCIQLRKLLTPFAVTMSYIIPSYSIVFIAFPVVL